MSTTDPWNVAAWKVVGAGKTNSQREHSGQSAVTAAVQTPLPHSCFQGSVKSDTYATALFKKNRTAVVKEVVPLSVALALPKVFWFG